MKQISLFRLTVHIQINIGLIRVYCIGVNTILSARRQSKFHVINKSLNTGIVPFALSQNPALLYQMQMSSCSEMEFENQVLNSPLLQ